MKTFSDGGALPKVFIFDLDYTLWPFWIDTHVSSPIRAGRDAWHALDRHGQRLEFFGEVPAVLAELRAANLNLAAASRTHAPDLARKLLSLLKVPLSGPASSSSSSSADARLARDMFDDLQIFPGNKVAHMRRIRDALGIEYADMLFFDDEGRNRNVERELGVCFVLVTNGVTRDLVDKGVLRWRKAQAVSSSSQVESKTPRKGGEDWEDADSDY